MLDLDLRRDDLPQPGRRFGEDRPHGEVEPIDFLLAQAPTLPKGRQLRCPEDLVAVRIADARDEVLVAEQ